MIPAKCPEGLQKETVELLENGAERNIHQINDNGDYKGSNGYNHCTTLQFTPSGPGNFMNQFIISFAEIGSDFFHVLMYILIFARVEGIEPSTNGFGDRYSTN